MIVFLGVSAAVVVVGVLLPWVSGTVTTAFGSIPYSGNGLEDTAGIISLVLGVANGGLGIWAGQSTGSARIAAIGTIILGIAVIMLAVNTLTSIGGGNFSWGGMVTIHASPGPGLYVTIIGGLMLVVGGAVAAIRERD